MSLEGEVHTSRSESIPGGSGTGGGGEDNKGDAIAALNHLVQGKRHLLVEDYPSAVESLQQACHLFCKIYGELSRECAEVHFYYGKALLQLARLENGVIGDGIEQDESQDSEDDNQEENKTSEEGDDKGTDEGDDKGTDDTGDEDDKEKGEEGEDITSSSKEEEKEGPSQKAAEDGAAGDEGEDGEDVATLQLAWEVLETAKVIYLKYLEEKPEYKVKLIDTLLLLGEVSLESDDYRQAISDFQESLTLQKSHAPPDSREMAHTYYQLGIAYAFDNRFTDAVKAYQECYNILMLRMENLKKQIEAGQGNVSSSADAFDTPERELKEIESLIPEIKSKIEDEEITLATLPEASKKLLAMKEKQDSKMDEEPKPIFLASLKDDSPKISFSSSKKPVNDISSLVKRKRPFSANGTSISPPPKKPSNDPESTDTLSSLSPIEVSIQNTAQS